MKMIRAMIRPESEELVTQALDEANISGFTKWDVLGRGKQKGIQVGAAVYPEIPKLTLLLVVEDDQVQKAVGAIQEGARTGHPGDGRIFVTDVESAYTVRTGKVER
jgi:nitrogen regulatory protein PII 1